MPLFMLLLAALLLPVPASASDWQKVGEDILENIYIDKESIHPTGDGHYRVWMKD